MSVDAFANGRCLVSLSRGHLFLPLSVLSVIQTIAHLMHFEQRGGRKEAQTQSQADIQTNRQAHRTSTRQDY